MTRKTKLKKKIKKKVKLPLYKKTLVKVGARLGSYPTFLFEGMKKGKEEYSYLKELLTYMERRHYEEIKGLTRKQRTKKFLREIKAFPFRPKEND